MTETEELRYLIGIVTEASRYDGTSEQDNVRLEVESRIARLIEAIHAEHAEHAAQPAKRTSHDGQVFVRLGGGKRKWVEQNLCVQVPCKTSRTGFSWRLKEGIDVDGT